ncbi:hypothetical protein HD806DRAFT_494748 [Xylariaceae sp. AK1471]|nr:hypothetical protein HD806DRAFT_494748 [Xylariaceae sp. AK1471]
MVRVLGLVVAVLTLWVSVKKGHPQRLWQEVMGQRDDAQVQQTCLCGICSCYIVLMDIITAANLMVHTEHRS